MGLFEALLISLGINIAMFIPAYFFKTDKLTDISYAATFIVVVWALVFGSSATLPSIILAVTVTLWAVRLGTYLLIRIHRMGKDNRFDSMRGDFLKFAGFWLLQGLTVWVVLIPSALFIGNEPRSVPLWSFIGILVWFIGLSIETFSDLQLFRFIINPANRGKWITTGLWRFSRHPNYFGEILLWFGVYMFVVAALNGSQILLGLIGPLYIAGLILFVSGVPILEKKADARWKKDPAFQEYKRRTSIVIPLPVKK